jgi:haloalkane dehalogenase
MDDGAADLFSMLRVPGTGERLVLEENFFVEQVLPAGMNRALSPDERAAYREPYPSSADRRPVLAWTRQIPVAGDPPDVHEVVSANQELLLHGTVPRLLLHGTPGSVVGADVVAWCRANSTGVDIVNVGEGTHFLPEDQPVAIADAIRSWLASSAREERGAGESP